MGAISARRTDAVIRPSGLLRYDPSWLRRYGRTSGVDERIKRAEMDIFTELVTRWTRNPGRTQRPGGMLDIGTCTGRYLLWGLRAGYSPVCGLDRSAAAVRHCTDDPALSAAHVAHGDILDESTPARLQAEGRRFVLATMMFGTVNHFTGADQQRALSQVRRCLVPGGVLVVSSWLPGGLRFSLYNAPARRFLQGRTMELPRLAALLEDAGLALQATGLTECHLLALARRP
jgi:SAM-dependent methyltransferase